MVTRIQNEVNRRARLEGRPLIDLLNDEEYTTIRDMIGRKVWPQGLPGRVRVCV